MLPYKLTTYPVIRSLRRPWKIFQALIANIVFGFPSRKIKVIGITGTTGKTTTIQMTAVALESAGYTVGVVSSIRVQIGTKVEKNKSGLTSLGPWQLQKLLVLMVKSGCHYAVIEVSSHALDQFRFWGVDFDVAAITNLSRDHLDYHHTLEDYANAKRRLFKAVEGRREKKINGKYVPRVVIASLDDPKTVTFLEEKVDYRYGLTLLNPRTPTPSRTEPISLYAIKVLKDKTTAMVVAHGRNSLLYLQLPGAFNVRNALVAIGVGVSQGIPVERICKELYKIKSIPGRFDKVEAGQPFDIVIDYAVTEAALHTLYDTIRTLRPKRILSVFGACGDRDKGKRPGMAGIVGTHADIVFLTNEDPFSEDPEVIFAALEEGMKKVGSKKVELGEISKEASGTHMYVKIPDRREAIRAAVSIAKEGDYIVATGKGVEESMRFKNKTVPWNERAVFEEELRKLYGSSN